MSTRKGLLLRLAQLYGVQTAYYGADHKRKQADPESLLAILQVLGAPVANLNDVPSAYHQRQQSFWQTILEPVTIVWDGNLNFIQVKLPTDIADSKLACRLALENSESTEWQWQGNSLPTSQSAEIAGTKYFIKNLPLRKKFPWGYHRFTLEIRGKRAESLIISAPPLAFNPPQNNRSWGIFIPLYSLQSKHNWGAGDFSDFRDLIDWIAMSGGRTIASLPLLATYLDEPFEPSPYFPISRLLWNEFYIDVTLIPELARCPTAQSFLNSRPFQKEVETLRQAPLVYYRRQMALKKIVLRELSQCLFDNGSSRHRTFERFVRANPVVDDYACFRAAVEKQGKPWRLWSECLRQGNLRNGDYDEAVKRYHMYVQWITHEQMQAITEQANRKGVSLCLDLPLGTHPDGYDAWRYQDEFVSGVSVGAPPDTVFTRGQNWAFPPLHPERLRQHGYKYFIECLRHHLQHASVLRIDHVMGLHRLFFIPEGSESRVGAYVRYHPEEMYAILALESQRYQRIIVGEDLGIVPDEVRNAMNRHGLNRMYVMHYELAANAQPLLHHIPDNSIASLNTHDMPPFASFWRGQDIRDRLKLGILNQTSARQERATRSIVKKRLAIFLKDKGWLKGPINELSVLNGCLSYLSASQAHMVSVNLEDLWLETKAQNVPSTTDEHPNWHRKTRHDFETFCKMSQVETILKEVNRQRWSKDFHHGTDRKTKGK